MSDAPPQLGDIPQYSELNVPTLSSTNGNATNYNNPTTNGSATMENVKASVYNSEVVEFSALNDALPTLTWLICSS